MESRSHDLWGGEEGLEKERERREEAKEKKKQNKYSKQVKGNGEREREKGYHRCINMIFKTQI